MLTPTITIIVVVLGIALIGLISVALLFNGMVKHRNRVSEAWSGIDVQLKRRHNLVPNLVEVVKTFQIHERETLGKVAEARRAAAAANGPADAGIPERDVTAGLRKLFALSEKYPELKSDRNFRQLSDQLVEIEDQIQFARRYYNGSVRDYNTIIESFPANLLAGPLQFQRGDFFELETSTEGQAPQVSL
ncbi:MAG: LemA family protein [Verrucomicrobiales bacterium]|nr:LemA family protein [Verrucomicrobiales bacterium]